MNDPQQKSHPPRGGLKLLLFVMCLALALVIGAGSSLSLALPDIATATGASQTQLTWVVNAYALVFAALLLPVGIAADRFGRRSALLLGLALFAAASFTSGLVDDPGVLIALRGVAGVGAAAVMPATLSVLVDAYPEDEQSRAVSVWAGVSGAGALVGILAAGVLLDQFWWGSVQVVYGVAAGLAVIACAAVVPPSNNPDLALDVPGGLLSLGGLAGIVFAVIEGPERGWTSGPVTVGALAGGALLALFVWHELRTPEPMLDVRLFTSPLLTTGSLIVFLQFFAAFGFFFLAPQWLQYVHRLDSLATALWLLPVAAGIGPASAAGPALLEKLGPGRLAGLGMALMAMATGALAAQAGGGQSLWVFAATLIGFGFGFGLAITPGTTLIIGGLPDDRRTLSAAVNDVTREVGGALGGAVAASVLIAVYAQDLSTGLANSPIPASAQQSAEDGVAQALAISGDLGRDGASLVSTAVEAFANGYGAALWVAASALLVGASASVFGARSKTHPTRGRAIRSGGSGHLSSHTDREGSQPVSPR